MDFFQLLEFFNIQLIQDIPNMMSDFWLWLTTAVSGLTGGNEGLATLIIVVAVVAVAGGLLYLFSEVLE